MFTSPYIECPSCRCVIFDPTWSLVTTAHACPNCQKTGEIRRIWPALLGNVWMDSIYGYPNTTAVERNLISVMLCASAELLMENLLGEILYTQGGKHDHIEILLDAHEGRKRQMDLFKTLCKISLKEALIRLGQGGFYDSWEKTVKARNKFVHGSPPIGNEPDSIDIDNFRANLLLSFYLLNNCHVVGLTPGCSRVKV